MELKISLIAVILHVYLTHTKQRQVHCICILNYKSEDTSIPSWLSVIMVGSPEQCKLRYQVDLQRRELETASSLLHNAHSIAAPYTHWENSPQTLSSVMGSPLMKHHRCTDLRRKSRHTRPLVPPSPPRQEQSYSLPLDRRESCSRARRRTLASSRRSHQQSLAPEL